MRLFSILGSLVLMCCLFVGCNHNTVEVLCTSVDKKNTIAQDGNIVFEFSKDIAPTSIVDEWTDEKYIRFSPKLEGKFKWIDNRTLIFSPSSLLEMNQNIEADVTDKVLFNSKEFDLKNNIVQIHTPYFAVVVFVSFFLYQSHILQTAF